ncbi:MAG: family 16 glycosylhydrolase [Hyphomonadaceae bacterium]
MQSLPPAPERAAGAHDAAAMGALREWWRETGRGLADRAAQAAWALALALMALAAAAMVLAAPVLMVGSVVSMIQARETRQIEAAQADALLQARMAELEGVRFIDRFDSVDPYRWRVSDGWDNGAWMANDWRASQIDAGASGLTITLDRHPDGGDKLFASGEMQTHEEYQYGYFETRMRVPRGEGLVTGFFTYTQPNGRPTWEEIDIEILGRDTRTMEVTYHLHGRSRMTSVDLGFDAAEDFHTYGFEWTPEAIRWYVDNRLVHEVNGPSVREMRRPQRFYLHLWSSTELFRWVGHINPYEAPWRLAVACVAQAETYRGRALCAD